MYDPAKYKEYYEENKDRKMANRSKESVARAARKSHLKRRYGITVEFYDNLAEQQDNRCAICGNQCQTGYRLAVDHSHDTGKVRGLLCRKHNQALGAFSLDQLKAAVKYMEANDG